LLYRPTFSQLAIPLFHMASLAFQPMSQSVPNQPLL